LKAEGNPRAEAFKKGMTAVIPKIMGNLKNYSFYLGESSNPDGTVILAFYKDEDQHNPYLWYIFFFFFMLLWFFVLFLFVFCFDLGESSNPDGTVILAF
jgi:hypothetical protein